MKRQRLKILCAALVCVLLSLTFAKMEWRQEPSTSQNPSAKPVSLNANNPSQAIAKTPSSETLGAVGPARTSNATAQEIPGPVIYSNEDGGISLEARKQIASLEAEKSRRTPAQLKMDSQLVYADRMRQGKPVADGVPVQRVQLDRDSQGRVVVDIRATVTPELLRAIESAGGNVAGSYPQYRAVRASLPLAEIEPLAARADVSFVEPAVRALLNKVDSQGDTAQLASAARARFGVTGANVKVGVISSGLEYLAGSQINGLVTVLPGQSGTPSSGEGTALLEIVNDLAPGAQLFFATGGQSSEAQLAQNILNLQAAGCNIIVDDVSYFDESPFQDGIVATAVNQATSAGVIFFSAAGNFGSVDRGSSGTWEGDFADGGLALNFGEAGRFHAFAPQTNYNAVTSAVGAARLNLFWSDPLGASTNDYDLFVLSASGTNVVASSTNPQTGTQDPYESLGPPPAGELIVVLKKTGVARFLHLDTMGGRLNFNTPGSTRGHSCTTNAFCIAAVYAGLPGGTNAFAGGAQDPVEQFSADGPRRVFYQADGTPITPGNFSSTGGAVRQKPDLAASDGVANDINSFLLNPIYGTSAAAPHAAAIAALLLSYNPTLTPAQVRSLLTTNALDIMAAGVDRDSGYGIVMGLPTLLAAPPPPLFMNFSVTNGQINATFSALLGKPYTIQYSTNLVPGDWMTLTNFTASNAYGGFADSLTNSQRYYRIQTTTN